MGKWHKLGQTRLYSIWKSMKTRCYNKKCRNYRWYGAKAIEVCEEWHTFLPFYQWAIENGYSDTLTLDRIDSRKGYAPSNCRWISIEQQQRNRSDNHLITINGETRCLSEWSRLTGVNYSTAIYRHKRGLSWNEAFGVNTT